MFYIQNLHNMSLMSWYIGICPQWFDTEDINYTLTQIQISWHGYVCLHFKCKKMSWILLNDIWQILTNHAIGLCFIKNLWLTETENNLEWIARQLYHNTFFHSNLKHQQCLDLISSCLPTFFMSLIRFSSTNICLLFISVLTLTSSSSFLCSSQARSATKRSRFAEISPSPFIIINSKILWSCR